MRWHLVNRLDGLKCHRNIRLITALILLAWVNQLAPFPDRPPN
jgi:hypothetical protein